MNNQSKTLSKLDAGQYQVQQVVIDKFGEMVGWFETEYRIMQT